MAWWITALIWVGVTAIGLLLRPKTKGPTPGQVQFPRAEADAAIPVLFGRYRVGINWVHHATTRTGRNKEAITAFGLNVDKRTIGYFYFIAGDGILCHGGVHALYDVIIDGKISIAGLGTQTIAIEPDVNSPTWETTYVESSAISPALPDNAAIFGQAQETYQIECSTILGGKTERGGVSGPITLYTGRTGIAQPDPLLAHLSGILNPDTLEFDAAQPAYPWLCHVVFGKRVGSQNYYVYMGTQPALPAIEFDLLRVPDNWAGEFDDTIGDDISPPRCLYELLVHHDWGLGMPPDLIDASTFAAAGNTCQTEGLGISFLLTDTQAAREVIADLLRVMNGVLYLNPVTGLLSLRLIRHATANRWGTVAQGVTDLTPANVDAVVDDEAVDDAIVNEVKVVYTDRTKLYAKRTVTARNLAAIYELGRTESRTVEFIGVCTRAVAQHLAERELRTLAQPSRKLRLVVDRTGALLAPGAWVRVTWPPLGLSQAIYRVLDVREARHGQVEVEAVAHSFDVETTITFGTDDDDVEPPGTGPTIPVLPYVLTRVSQTTSTGTLELAVVDPESRVTLVEFRTKVGAADWGDWTPDTAPYAATVARDALEESLIAYRVTYTDPNGNDETIEDVVIFARSADAAPAEALLDRSDGAVLFDRSTGSQLYNRP